MCSFVDICNYAAARRCFEAGHTVADIAKSAKVSQSTIREWLEQTEHVRHSFRQKKGDHDTTAASDD